MSKVPITPESNKVWRVTKLINPDSDFNYFGIDILDEAVFLEDDLDVKDRVLVVRVNKTTEELYIDYMGPKSNVLGTLYSKGDEVTVPANKQALKQAIISYFEDNDNNSEFISDE